MQWLNAQQPNIFECRAFSPFKTVPVISPLQFCFFNVYPEFIYRNLAQGVFAVSGKPVFAAVLFTISKIYSSTSTRISEGK